ncbi:putative tail structural protein [Methylophilales phage MEP301]|nr:putative tail structural protein [Methylophilales phage MEP301]
MATIINADTSDGLKLTSDTSGQLELQSAGSTKVTMDTTGNVGIGTTSPAQQLHLSGTGAIKQRYTRNANSTDISLASNGMFNTDNLAATGFGWYNNGSERMRIDSSGTLFLGQTSNPATGSMVIKVPTTVGNGINFQSTGTATSYAIGIYNNTGGNVGSISFTTTSTAYNTSSDYRLKENVAPMSGSIDRLKQLKPSTWLWTQDGSHGEGFLAHEAQEVVPESVHGNKDAMRTEEYEVTPAVLDDDGNVVTEAVMGTREVPDYQGIDQSKLVPLLTAALQEAIQRIEALEAK